MASLDDCVVTNDGVPLLNPLCLQKDVITIVYTHSVWWTGVALSWAGHNCDNEKREVKQEGNSQGKRSPTMLVSSEEERQVFRMVVIEDG